MTDEPIVVTSIVRLSDSLPLVSGAEPSTQKEEVRSQKQQQKKILSSLSKVGVKDPEACIPLGSAYVQYLVENNVIFCGLFAKSFPQSVAAAYLAELKKEFFSQYDERRIAQAAQPYAFMAFEAFLEKTKKLYQQNRTMRELQQVTSNLADIHRVMTRSLSEVVQRGEDIGALGNKSDAVLAESEQYRKVSVELNKAKFWQKYGVIIVILAVFVLVFYVRYKWFSD